VKFCGCQSWSDVSLAIETGADAFGMIFAPSPRRIDLDAAATIAKRLTGGIEPVAVFVNPASDEIDAVRAMFPTVRLQLAGNESPEFAERFGSRAIKVIHVDDAIDVEAACAPFRGAGILFDTKVRDVAGGSGETFRWQRVAAVARSRPVIVAGGLTSANVGDCVRAARPWGVDVRGGIESGGRKSEELMRAFIGAVRAADAA